MHSGDSILNAASAIEGLVFSRKKDAGIKTSPPSHSLKQFPGPNKIVLTLDLDIFDDS
jgi:hypothetical protein